MYLTEKLNITTPSPEQVVSPLWENIQSIQLSVKRDDLLHPVISGNKWRKLKHTLVKAVQDDIQHIVSFGGGFSNHLHALAYCCHQLGIQFTAIVRGDYSNNLSPMLQDLLNWHVNIQYVSRLTYKQRTEANYLYALQNTYPKALIIPEGGSQQQALQGVMDVVHELDQDYDYIVAPVASGGTLAGLINGVAEICPSTKLLGIGVLKGPEYLEQLVTSLLPKNLPNPTNWHINHDYHCGGYAKSTLELTRLCSDFYQQTNIKIEPVYSGKLFFALRSLIANQYFPSGSRILALHTGGLQGAR